MYEFGKMEVDAVAKVIKSKKMFRYNTNGHCGQFEAKYAKFLNVKHVTMTSSGTTALTAGLIGLGVGPGDEVIVPAHTYMASAVAILAAGAIPIIADIDESITLSPEAFEKAIGKYTKAVMPVHMWGQACNMKAIMKIARKHKILVIEDACQGVGGGYEGKMFGSIGHAGGFSFNTFKNMTCGEGGAVVTSNNQVALRARCQIDCCNAFWTGRKSDPQPFISNGSRASEFEGAMMLAQMKRIGPTIRNLRSSKKKILKMTEDCGLTPAPVHSLDYECGTCVMYTMESAEQANQFQDLTGCIVTGKTGRHTFNEWTPILDKNGAHHPALNPYNLPANKRCRRTYPKTLCRQSLDILNRTVMLRHPLNMTANQLKTYVNKIKTAAKKVL